MTHCASCGRLKSWSTEPRFGGPVCATQRVVPPVGRDLFGYDIDAAAEKARVHLGWVIGYAALSAKRDSAGLRGCA